MTDRAPNALSVALIALMKGLVEREAAPALWQDLIAHQARVRDHIAVIGLDLVLDEAEGYAYLRQKPAIEGDPELPRLITRRQLSYPVSLLLALLRKALAEFDATSGEIADVAHSGSHASDVSVCGRIPCRLERRVKFCENISQQSACRAEISMGAGKCFPSSDTSIAYASYHEKRDGWPPSGNKIYCVRQYANKIL